MSAISNDSFKLKSGKLNTTINPDVLGAFRYKCKQQGVQMNTILEAFMRQYIKGGFYLKFGRETATINVEFDESEVDSLVVDTVSNSKTVQNVEKSQDIIKDNFGEIVEE